LLISNCNLEECEFGEHYSSICAFMYELIIIGLPKVIYAKPLNHKMFIDRASKNVFLNILMYQKAC
jgi:hypothetical protein